jgi:hypothetical protein
VASSEGIAPAAKLAFVSMPPGTPLAAAESKLDAAVAQSNVVVVVVVVCYLLLLL